MIYSASYFEPQYHLGLLISISRSEPQSIKPDGKLDFFAPGAELLILYKKKLIDQDEYINRYRKQTKANWNKITEWLKNLDPKPDYTLLCWEKKGEFCHRNLVMRIVQKYRPDCYGGKDRIKFEMPKCPSCLSEMIPALITNKNKYADAHFCYKCKKYTKESV